ncbi:MAG: transglutaminase domain-containing protein [Oscillospiraceae bacterium]|nr:transglutaminase domain-containing protein [Oscillospiraceae bacterium]
MKLRKLLIILALVLATVLTACAPQSQTLPPQEDDTAEVVPPQEDDAAETSGEEPYIDATPLVEVALVDDEAVALADAPLPATSTILKPVASGTKTQKNNQATIDYSNIADGYVMVQCASPNNKRLKVQVAAATTYTYNLTANQWTTFPLSDGNTKYKVTVFENTVDKKYAEVLSVSFDVALKDEFAPFLRPNQYVNYENAANTIKKAEELTNGVTDPLKKVEKVYNFVVNNITYDRQKAATVQSGYLPVLDTVLANKTGICFDYAALMTGMLRSQGVPCKLVVGYAGQAYHAWVSVWTKESGWIDGAIFFDGTTWHRMDPTFISSGKNSKDIQKYVGDGSNYTVKYLY